MTEHAPLILDIAGLSLTDVDRRRLAHPLTGGMILFAPQLAGPRAAGRAVRRNRRRPRRPADLRGPRRRPRAALSHRRLHPPAADAGPGRAVDEGRAGGHQRRHGRRLRAGGRVARLRRGLQLHAGARPGLGRKRRHRRPRLPPRPAGGRAAGQEPDARPAARRHGQLRQALSRARLRQGRFAHRHPGGPAQPQGDPGRRRRALRMAQHLAVQRDAGARRLPEGGRAAGRLFQPLAQRRPARASWVSAARSSATT